MLAWFAFDLALSIVRGVWRMRERVEPRHAILAGCLTLLAACGVTGLLLFFGSQLTLGIVVGGIASFVFNRTQLPTLAQLAGLDPTPEGAGAGGPLGALVLPRGAAAIVALVCLVAGFLLAGLGTIRVLEAYAYATDTACAHPCGMVHGLWVQVLPDARGDFVARLDPVAVQLRVRFWNDVAGVRVASRSAFSVPGPTVIYEPLTDRRGCDPWPPRTLRLDDRTGDLPLCFAIPQSQNVDFGQLVLQWGQEGVTAPILLGKTSRGGVGIDIEIGVTPSPSPP